MLPIKKIYIDSRFKTSDSTSHSDFKIDLPVSLLMPENTGFYISDVSIPKSWYTINSGRNNTIWFRMQGGAFNTATIPNGDYSVASLANAIATAMSTAVVDTGVFTATANPSTNTITIANKINSPFKIYTDAELPDQGLSPPFASINTVLQNVTAADYSASFTSGYVSLQNIRNLYIVSPNLGTYKTLCVNGERGVIKKVPVTANYNEMIFDQVLVQNDYLDCSRQTLSRIEFQLKDVYGNIVELNGNHWSFSIIFSKIPDE